MNDEHDSLEMELRTFRPREPSRALLQRIGRELAGPHGSVRRPPGILVGVGLVAASLAAIAFFNHLGNRRQGVIVDATVHVARTATATPTVHAYRQALAKSPQALDELLSQQARRGNAAHEQGRPLTASAALRSGFLNSLGDS